MPCPKSATVNSLDNWVLVVQQLLLNWLYNFRRSSKFKLGVLLPRPAGWICVFQLHDPSQLSYLSCHLSSVHPPVPPLHFFTLFLAFIWKASSALCIWCCSYSCLPLMWYCVIVCDQCHGEKRSPGHHRCPLISPFLLVARHHSDLDFSLQFPCFPESPDPPVV